MLFPPIFRVLFGIGFSGRTGDARSEISEADGSDPPLRDPRVGAARGGFSQTLSRPLEGRSRPESIPAGRLLS